MNVKKSIYQLLFQYDCVIIPGFGGFVAQKRSAVFHPLHYTFEPPKKVIAFNSDLTHDDGLLTQALIKINGCSYQEASDAIEKTIKLWKETLQTEGNLILENIGKFKSSSHQLEFIPNKDLNFSFDSYGMTDVKGNYILRKDNNTVPKEKSNSWVSYAAAIGFAFMVGASGFFANDNFIQPQLSSFIPLLNDSKEIKIEPTSESIAPKINLETLEKEQEITVVETFQEVKETTEPQNELEADSTEEIDLSIKKYQVIGGSFKVYSQAMEHQARLKKQGFDRAVIIGKVGNYFMVAIDTFHQANDAYNLKNDLEKQGMDVFVRP